MTHYTVMDYCYRDSANYKAYGSVAIRGQATEADEALIRSSLIDGLWFVAADVGMPSLIPQLRGECGTTQDDHGWREFVRLRVGTPLEVDALPVIPSARDLVARFYSAGQRRA